jgi:hypothetical protein
LEVVEPLLELTEFFFLALLQLRFGLLVATANGVAFRKKSRDRESRT